MEFVIRKAIYICFGKKKKKKTFEKKKTDVSEKKYLAWRFVREENAPGGVSFSCRDAYP
jgi:hypothetical protein